MKKVFKYSGKNKTNVTTKGIIEADNIASAKSLLRRQGITRIKIAVTKIAKKKRKRITPFDIATLTRQLATMAFAGIPLVQSLTVVMDGMNNLTLADLIRKVKVDIENGQAFSTALRHYPVHFNALYCNLIQAGEQSGSLETMLDRLALYMEKTESLKRKIKKAMFYPITIFAIAAIVSVILLLKVVPTFEEMFKTFDAELPWFTQKVLNLSRMLQEHGFIVLFIISVGIITSVRLYRKFLPFRHAIQRLILKIPIFGPLIRKTIVARFGRTLATTFCSWLTNY